ncbi:MAG: thioredoxin family protein [Phycisphaerales bacterium]
MQLLRSCVLGLAAALAAPAAADPPSPTGGAEAPANAAGAAARPAADAKKVYDESADAKAQIESAIARARAEHRRVLVQWGGNWCPWCIRLHALCSSDREIAKTLQYEYDVVMVDTGHPTGKNVDLARSFGAEVESKGFPYLTILDENGKPVANQETESLEVKNEKGESAGVSAGHDPAKVLAFLRKHQAPPLAAADVMDGALRDAKASNRRVLLHFGAPWCPWCHRLDDWLRGAEVRGLVAKDFIDVKIDVDRMTGGKELLAKYNAKAGTSGIPWFAILDADGTAIATSTMPGGANTGFPAKPEEIEHFASMVRGAARALSPDEQAKLVESLRTGK